MKLSNGNNFEAKEIKLSDLFETFKFLKREPDDELNVVKYALSLVCDLSIDDIVGMSLSDVEKIVDEVKRKNRKLKDIVKATHQEQLYDKIIVMLSASLSKVLLEMYMPAELSSVKQEDGNG